MAAFWNESTQTRVPFVQKFNDAIRGSEHVVEILGLLSVCWAVTAGMFGAVGLGLMGSGLGMVCWVVGAGLVVARWAQKQGYLK